MKGKMKSGKKKAMRLLSILMVAAMLVTLFSGGTGQVSAAVKKKVKSITVTKPAAASLTLVKGATYQLKKSIAPKNASNKKMMFKSSKKSVVSVSGNGKLKAKKVGKAAIKITAKDGSKVSTSIKITVVKKLVKVKKVKLNQTKATLYIGGTSKEGSLKLKTTLTPKKATTKTVKYTSSSKSVAGVSKKGVVTARKVGGTIITAYAADGWGKSATCKVTVKKKPSKNTNPPAKTTGPTTTPAASDQFTIATKGKATNIYLDIKGKDYQGLNLIAKSFANDVKLVSDTTPAIKTDFNKLDSEIIVAGSIGNNQLIDKWIREGKINVSDIKDKWETYKIFALKNPESGVLKATVIVGSDKRGTIYGIYRISEMMGVSPWVYWGDATPKKQSSITYTRNELNYTSKVPSVKYRGIFLNDEAPSLTSWLENNKLITNNGGKEGANEEFYEKVFELILRCKGNYLWPAMWSYIFSENGKAEPIANAKLADIYGIVMGASHHEPMMRAGEEWKKDYSKYGAVNDKWDYSENGEAMKKFWDASAKRNGAFENLIALGIRGEGDSEILPGGTTQQNVDLLKQVITDQKKILKDNGLSKTPTVMTLYKEVEEFWHGKDEVAGLKDWDGLDDVTIMLAEDNFGNLRTLPTEQNRNREKGWGMYYHFDYHGGPTSYEWINTVPLEKTWEQMSMAYDYGVKEVWIVNVGDLKPMEMGISYFLDMAYDFDKWGTNGINKTDEYRKQWVKQQFGEGLDEKGIDDISSLIQDYLQMNGNRKPETLKGETYNFLNYNEAQETLQNAKDIITLADQYMEIVPDKLKAAYFQLVYYPAVATATVVKMQIYKGLNELYASQGRTAANTYATLVKEAIQEDQRLQKKYNQDMPGVGKKWEGMMSSAHVGYVTWNDVGAAYPTPEYVVPEEGSIMLVAPKGTAQVYKTGSGSLPDFTNINKEQHYIDVANAGGTPFTYEATASRDWIVLSKAGGRITTQDTIGVSIDWSKVTNSQEGTITIKGADATVTIRVNVVYSDVSGLDDMTFVEAHNVVSIDANHFSNKVVGKDGSEWKVINDYGRTASSMKTFPTTRVFTNTSDAPYLEYKVYVSKAGKYNLQAYLAPSNNVDWDKVSMKYAVAVGNETPKEVETLGSNFMPGAYSGTWSVDVVNNIRMVDSEGILTLKQGMNTIRIYTVDAPLVLQKLVLYRGDDGIKSSYLGPWESYYKGKQVESKLNVDVQENEFVVPGEIEAAYYDDAKDVKVEDGLKIAAGKSYTYSMLVSATDSYSVKVFGDSEEGGTISLALVNGTDVEEIGEVEIKQGETTFLPLKEIKQGRHKLTVTGVSGEVTLDRIRLSLLDTTLGEPVYIKTSHMAESYLPELAFDKNEATIWKAANDDNGSWIEFEYENEYYFNSLTFTGKNVNKLKAEIYNGSKWVKAFEGTNIKSGDFQLTTPMSGYKVRITFEEVTGVPIINEINLNPYRSEDGGSLVTELTTSVKNLAVSSKETTTKINGGTEGNHLMDNVEGLQPKDGVKEIIVTLAQKSKIRKIELTSEANEFLYYYMDGTNWVSLKDTALDKMVTENGVYVVPTELVETEKIKIVANDANGVQVSQIYIWEELPVPEALNIKQLYFTDFEQDMSGVISNADAAVDVSTNESYEGKQSLYVNNRTAHKWSTMGLRLEDVLKDEPRDPNQKYYVSCWIKSAGDPQDMYLVLAKDNNDILNGPNVRVTDSWTYFEASFDRIDRTLYGNNFTFDDYNFVKIHGDDKKTDFYVDNLMIYKEVDGCSCNLQKPTLTNEDISLADVPTEVELIAEATKSNTCAVEGHSMAEVEYSYTLISDTTGTASIKGNKLSVSATGEVAIKVTATVSGQKRFFVKTLMVK